LPFAFLSFTPGHASEGFSARLKRHGKTVIEISGDDFAVRQTD
jgi:hypothetical protein